MRTTTIAAMLAICTGAAAQQTDAPENPLFALLDRVDPLDTTPLQLVCVERLEHGYVLRRFAWVVTRDGADPELRFLDLGRAPLRAGGDTRILATTPTAVADELIAELPRYRHRGGDRWYMPSPETPMHPEAVMVMLARACARRGDDATAERLLRAAPNHRLQLADGLLRRVLLDFADPRVEWTTLRERRRLLIAEFGGNGRFDTKAAMQQLDDVVTAVEDPATSELKRALIDDPWLDGNIYFDAGPMRSPEPEPTPDRRPLDLLLARGMTLVPDLIALLDDPTATRSMHYGTKYGGTFGSNTVGDQAHAALVRMLGVYLGGAHLRDRRAATWREWYEQHQGGDLRTIAEQNLDATRPDTVRRYLQRWPDGIDRVMQMATDWPHEMPPAVLAAELARDPRWREVPAVRELIQRCLDHELPDSWRKSRAHALARGGWPDSITRLRAEFATRDLSNLPEFEPRNHDPARWELLELLRRADVATWNWLRDRTADMDLRRCLAHALLVEPDLLRNAGLLDDHRAEAATAASRALARLLTDLRPVRAQWNVATDERFAPVADVTIADAAAFALHAFRPADFPYVPVHDGDDRRRQLDLLRQLIGR